MGDESVETRVLRHDWRLEALDRWRAESVDPRLGRLEAQLNEIVKADEIAQRIADATLQARARRFTWGEKATGLLVAAAAVATAVHSWVA